MNNLKYRVYSVSSQNQEFPAQNLQDMSGIWQAEQNCSYPQQLTVQFYVPIQTKNMKLMFHQYKIPKLIQVFVKCGKQQKYRKLGLIQPNDNSQSNYIQKQIKTIFFQFPCSFIKLIFHQNYRNQMNLFDQVALCELIFQGEVLPSSEYKNLDLNILDSLDTSSDEQPLSSKSLNQISQVQTQKQKKQISTFSSVMFPQLFQKLQQKKKQAVERQQFQKAAFIKNSLVNFEQLQKQILKLEELKKISLQEQDYDRCHKLKLQINKKKQMLAYQIKEFQDKIDEQQNILTFSRANNQIKNPNFVTHNRDKKNQLQELSQRTPAPNRNISVNLQQYDSQVVPALRKKKNVEQQYMTIGKANQSILDALKSPTTDKKQDMEVEQSLDYNNYDINKVLIQFPQLQQLQFKKFKKYEPFFDYIRLDLWRMFLSEKYWKVKSIALNQIMTLQVTQGKHLIAIMQAVAITICDKHTVNIKKSLQLLQKLVNMPNKDIWCDANYPRFFVDTILGTLIQLMNDTKQQFRKMAVEIYKNLPQFSLIYLQTAIKNIIKSSSLSQYSKNKRKSNPRLQQAKLAVIQYYLSTFTDVMHHLNQIIKWLAQCANDPSSEVKMTATQMLLQIARMDKQLYNKVKEQLVKQGSDVWATFQPQYQALITQIQSSKMIDNLIQTPNQDTLDLYKKQTLKNKNKNSSRISSQKVNQSSLTSGQKNKQSDEVQLAYSQESIQNKSHEWFANTEQREIKVMEPTDEELEGLCDYCYRKYSQNDYNEHLRNNCCVVVPCIHCGGVIYLRQMTEHLLTGCQKKHQQCQRCLLAFQFDQINEHVARKLCRKSRTHMQRCPYCEQDIQADDLSWVDHAQKCNKIIRPSPSRSQLSENEQTY